VIRIVIPVFWASLIVGTLLTRNVVANWAVALAGLYVLTRWWAGPPRHQSHRVPTTHHPPVACSSRNRRSSARRARSGCDVRFDSAALALDWRPGARGWPWLALKPTMANRRPLARGPPGATAPSSLQLLPFSRLDCPSQSRAFWFLGVRASAHVPFQVTARFPLAGAP